MNADLKIPPDLDAASLREVVMEGEVFYKIARVDAMRPFFMSIVSDADHWMFMASNGGISAGRRDPEHALFPYYTDDKITASAEDTGSKTIITVHINGKRFTWEPFSFRTEAMFDCTRNLYKSRYGNKIIFEEINNDLGLLFQYQWCSSNLYGFVRKCKLVNFSSGQLQISFLDGIQNILPYGVGSDLQMKTSNLADAYKRSELIPQTGVGIFALSAIIVDKAEPSEALKANVAWSLGLDIVKHLLSSLQLNNFRKGAKVQQEEEVKGDKGSYFIVSEITLQPNEQKEWMMVANVNQNHAAIVQLSDKIRSDKDLKSKVLADVELGTANLIQLVAAADGLQSTADDLKDTRHFSNVLFNIMRGGIFDDNYQVEKRDFSNYLRKANQQVYAETQVMLLQLPESFSVQALKEAAKKIDNSHFYRLATEYLPLKFSRRHGDPSRPWNQFSINTRNETDGSRILDYQGNWRDIFQNWEALAHSFPEFIEGMIFKFLNASTFDGYNPYRVTKDGFDWETIEPDNPWSYIGYWGDHQLIYLLKFFEFLANHRPGHIQALLNQGGFVYANVPYRIKPYRDILHDPKNTIVFDHQSDRRIHERMRKIGADGALLTGATGEIHEVCLCEKLLATLLSKLSNFVPGGGIWMNTQRPEWNDANNALVGNGLSMVTLCYLRRFLTFFQPVFETTKVAELPVSAELYTFFESITGALEQYKNTLAGEMSDTTRKKITDILGLAGSTYRDLVYARGFSGSKKNMTPKQILDCIIAAKAFLEHTISVNKRTDDLYHTYNLISCSADSMKVTHLSEMLEGQVAVLSSGCLSAEQSLKLLDALKSSSLYRPDQDSYILYPDKELPKFLEKNTIPGKSAESSFLFRLLLEDGNRSIIEKDIRGDLHFNGNFRNANDLQTALYNLDGRYRQLVDKELTLLLGIFEEVFCHKAFTGRSGTFFGYEGLGSIYWHMVSKLLLAVQETCIRAHRENAGEEICNALAAHFYAINEGIGVHKPVHVYGAFPTDPYSHTPSGKGAQQPGMTGQVKEDILCRFAELGVFVHEGKLFFNPLLLKRNQFNPAGRKMEYVNSKGERQLIILEENTLFFTYCQVPVIYALNEQEGLEITKATGTTTRSGSAWLTVDESASVFQRTGEVRMIKIFLRESMLRS